MALISFYFIYLYKAFIFVTFTSSKKKQEAAAKACHFKAANLKF